MAVAGCLAPLSRSDACPDGDEGTLSLDEATPAGVANEFATPLDSLGYATRTVVADALDAPAGDATSRGHYSPDPPTAFVVTGPGTGYHHVETADRDATRVTGYGHSVETGVDDAAVPDDVTPRPFADLPPHDRESLRSAIGNTGLLHAPHYSSFLVTFAYERPGERDRSVFVPGSATRYLAWDGTVVRVTFEEERPVRITTTTVSTERVATSPEAFRAHAGATRGVVLDSLTGDQRDVVNRAVGGTYTECSPYSEPFAALRERLSGGGDGGPLLVRYDGDWYFCRLS